MNPGSSSARRRASATSPARAANPHRLKCTTAREAHDGERILRSSKALPEEEGAGVKTAIPFKTGDRVRVKEGYFQNFEGDVHAIDETHGRVTVMINIFGRATPVEIEHWQIEAV